MPRIIVFEAARTVGFQELPPERLGAEQVRVRTLYSGISRGTELTNYRGDSAAFRKRWDRISRLYLEEGQASKRYPLQSEGYEEVGEVLEIGARVRRFRVGDRVCGVWGHWTEAVFDAEEVRVQKMPEGLEPILGAFLPIAHVAFNGILDAGINLGETVAVFGLGVVGQIVAQMARLSGAAVIGVDRIEERLELCRALGGADELVNAAREDAGRRIKGLTGNRGADVCIECTGAPPALHQAIRSCAYSSKVVAMGLMTTEGTGLYLGDEFHQNRINVVCSQIFAANPAVSHRWNHDRIQKAILQMMVQGRLKLRELVSHTIPFEEASRAFEILDKNPTGTMEVILSYEEG